jgi:DoxX-like family
VGAEGGSVYVVLVLVTAAINLWAAVADFMRAGFVLGNAAALDLPPRWLTPLGLLKAAGAAGLLFGLAGVPLIGTAAAVGLVLFFLGAVGLHVWKRVFHNIAYPGVFLGLAFAVLVV